MQRLFVLCALVAFAISSQAQITWNATASTVGTAGSGFNHPRIVLDRAGNPMVVWGQSISGMPMRVRFSRWDGMKFTTPIIVNPSPLVIASASWMGPDIAAHGDTVYIVMKQTPEAEDTCRIWCSHSYDGGKTFSAPVPLDTMGYYVTRFPAVTTSDDGNPIVAYMKFEPDFKNARWVVVRSTDFGRTFSADKKASGWSNANSTVCDCCPGTVVSSGTNVAMVYRDNNSNIRDSWAGFSADGGATFTHGMNVDDNYWSLNACPATGPSAVIVGDSIYSVFMNGASGKSLVYRSVAPLDGSSPAQTVPVTTMFSGLSQQNYPRIARSGNAASIVWAQQVNGAWQLGQVFTNDIHSGFPTQYSMVAMNNVVNADVAMHNGNAYAIWEDDNSGVIRFRNGTYPTGPNGVLEPTAIPSATAFPNPSFDGELRILVPTAGDGAAKITVLNVLGQQMYSGEETIVQGSIDLAALSMPAGSYVVKVVTNKQVFVTRILRN